MNHSEFLANQRVYYIVYSPYPHRDFYCFMKNFNVDLLSLGKLKLCREERERIMRERNDGPGMIGEDRKHSTRSPTRSPGLAMVFCIMVLSLSFGITVFP